MNSCLGEPSPTASFFPSTSSTSPPPFFSGLKLLLAGVKQPILRLNGYLNGKIMHEPKSMRNVHAVKSHISIRVLDDQEPTPPRIPAEGWGMLATQVSQVPRTSRPIQSRLQSQSKKTITLRESGVFGFVHRAWPAPAAGASQDHAGRAAALIAVGLCRVVHLPNDLCEQLIH